MLVRHCTWTLILLLTVPVAAQPQAVTQGPADSATTGYTVFIWGTPVGREDVTVVEDATGITIIGKGRLSAPASIVMRQAAVKYRQDWTPEFFTLDVNINGGNNTLKTTFEDQSALVEGVLDGQTVSQTDLVSSQPFVLPNGFFGSYEAISRRLSEVAIDSEFRAYVGPNVPEMTFRVSSVSAERMQTGTSTFNVRRYVLLFPTQSGVVLVNLYADEQGGLLRLNIPAQALDVVRDDLAASTARTLIYSNPGDEAVFIPSRGFNLGATLTRPENDGPTGDSARARAPERRPAVILIGGAASADRDGAVGGVPILGQLAGALAEAGFLAVRYDKRGAGQSGGRVESATMRDYAEDVRAIVRWLRDRRDVDRDRIAVIGHQEGAWLALLAASRERRIRAVVSIAAPSTTGAEWVLEQQRQTLALMSASPEDREAKIALQNKINAAVLSRSGWDDPDLTPDIRRQADTPWFESLLAFDPADVLDDGRQPYLFLHGELDREVPVAHVDQIAQLAREERESRRVSVVRVAGLNHLLVPAVTGDVLEYATLQDRNVASDVTGAINDWLAKTFAAIR